LGAHYQKAEFEARRLPDGQIQLLRATNIARFALRREVLEGETPRLRVGELELDLRGAPPGDWLEFENVEGKWQLAGPGEWRGKRPGLTGPIDDAFTAPFLCVRGTGTPWNPEVHAWSLGALQRFAAEWHQYFRGDLPIVDDVALTPAQLAKHHLVLFGDPGS
ncbi:MAG: hydrolase, partial [Planctomycetaceae bacterium]